MLKIQEALDLIIEHYIDELREARLGERHTIPDRYALTILEETEAIRNYVKPVLADRIRELDEQVPKIRIEDLTGEISGKEGKTSPVWHTGTPTEEGEYLIAFSGAGIEYGRASWDGQAWDINIVDWRDYNAILAWQKIEPYKEEKDGKCSH